MMTFQDFLQRYQLKKKTTSNIKVSRVFCSTGLNNVGIYLQDGPFSTIKGIVILLSTKGTRWVCFENENYFDS